jgi:hypothetical protein
MMHRLPVVLLGLGLALGPSVATAQWGASLEIGAARFSGTARDSNGATVGPHRPTTFTLRLDRGEGTVRLALSALYAEPGLAAQQGDLAFVQYGVFSLLEIAPEIAVRVLRFGAGVEARVEAGPALDLWNFDGEQRNRIGVRGGVALAWPLARSLSGSLRVTGGWTRSMVDPGDVPDSVARVSTRRFGVAIGLRYRL